MMKVFAVGLLLLTLLALLLVGSYVSAYNSGVSYETKLTAKLNDNKNILGQYTIKVSEIAQVPEMYKNDLSEIIKETFEGRYGKDGSQSTWQWIQEKNLNLDSSMYTKIQQVMEAGRNEFTVSQTELLDIKRSYEAQLGYMWSGYWLKFAGYPKIDLSKIKIVVANNTEAVFDSGVDPGIKLRPDNKVE